MVLGICSALAVTNKVENAIAMGLGVTFVIAVDLFLQAFFPSISKALGAYVGLIITNCIVMGRAEAFAVKNPVKFTLIDAFMNGMGYTYVLVLVSVVREILAFGTVLNMQVMPDGWVNWVVMAMAPGGFFVLGVLIWIMRQLTGNIEEQ